MIELLQLLLNVLSYGPLDGAAEVLRAGPAIPAVIGAGGAIGSALIGSRRSREEKEAQSAMSGSARAQTELARLLMQQGQALGAMGRPALEQTISAYMNRAGLGGRSALTAAISPELSAERQATRGAVQSLRSSMLDPTTKRVQEAVMRRDLAGRVGNRFALARSQALEQLSGLGTGLMNLQQGFGATGATAAQAGGSLYSALAQQFSRDREAQAGRTGKVFESLGNFLLPYLNRQGAGAGSPSPLPSTPLPPTYTMPGAMNRNPYGL